MSSLHDELVANIRANRSADLLMQRHASDPGGRCRVCRGGNVESGRVVFPCTIYAAAKAAQVQAERRGVWKPC